MSIESQLFKRISNHKRGKIFFPSDFTDSYSSTAVRQALNRLEKKDILIRLADGIYLYPKRHKLLGTLQPSIEDIAIAISKRDKARIIPTGIQALNKLGLSTQVPLNAVYLTDGTPRTIKIGNRTIKFKIASPKLLAVKNEAFVLVILALKEIGQRDIDKLTLSKVTDILRKINDETIKHDIKLAPAWVANIIQNAITSRK